MKYLIGVDFGGSSSKATLINEYGEKVCSATCEYPMIFPSVGWAEHDPIEIYNSFITNVRTIFEKSHILPIRLQRSLWMQEHILLFSG